MQQFQDNQPSHSQHQQNVPLAPHMYEISRHMSVQPMTMSRQYVSSVSSSYPVRYLDLTRGKLQYLSHLTDQFNLQVQQQYVYSSQFHPQQSQPYASNLNTPPPQISPQQQLFLPPLQNIFSSYISQSQSLLMSIFTSRNSDMSHSQSLPTLISRQSSMALSLISKDEHSPFVEFKKSSVIKIVNLETNIKVLNRYRQKFEPEWKVNLPLKPMNNETDKETELSSEEYYTAVKAKRPDLRLVQFIEMFNVNMLIKEIVDVLILMLLIIGMNVSFDYWVEQRILILTRRKLKVCTSF